MFRQLRLHTSFIFAAAVLVACSSLSSSPSSFSFLVFSHAAATFDWTDGSCSDSSLVYSPLQQACISNPCASGNVFDPMTETCSCPSPKIVDPPGALPSTTGVACIDCSAISHMTSRTLPPTCLPCAQSVLSTPPSVAFRNLFIQGGSTTVAMNGSTWVYGGGNILNADGSVSQERVSIVAAQWSATYKSCACPGGFILTNTIADGVNLKAFICARCVNATNATLAGPSTSFSCDVCTGGAQFDSSSKSCTCSALSSYLVQRDGLRGGDYCASAVLQSSVLSSGSSGTTSSTPVNLNNRGTNGASVESYAMSFATSSALGCAAKNATECQRLANLCALALYDAASAACVMHLRLHRAEGCIGVDNCEKPKTVPWLSYLRSSASVLEQTTVNMKVALRPDGAGVYDMKFVLFEYDVAGSLLLRRRLVDELSSCDINAASAKDFWFVGRSNLVTCNINILYYIQQHQLRNNPTKLYELFLEDSDGGGSLIPVPVVIDKSSTSFNFPETIDSALLARPSAVDQNPRPDAWRRRFFMVDNFAGRTSATSAPNHVTYVRSASVMIQLRKAGSSQIYVPIVYLQYASALVAPLLSAPEFATGVLTHLQTSLFENAESSPRFEYRVYFVKSDDDVIAALKPTVIVLCVIVFFTAFGRTYFWMRRQQDVQLTMATLVRFFVFLCNHFANIFAVYCYLTCGVFYVFYKHQSTGVEWLLPVKLDYVWGCLYAAFAAKMVVVLYYIVEQCNADYFVIDWERPRAHHNQDERMMVDPNNNNNTTTNINADLQSYQNQQQQQYHHQDAALAISGVSMWRSTFIANELNELQTRRSFRVLFVALLLLIFTEGAGYIDLARAVPNPELTPGGAGPWSLQSSILRVAVGGFFWIIISAVFYVVEFLVYYKFVAPHPLEAFVDLCSVSNISIVILLEPMWGFYIHGESLHPHSDVSVEEFQANLQREAKGLLPPRGMGGIPNCQTFEVFLGHHLRNFLYICYGHLYGEIGRALIQGVDGAPPSNVQHHRRCFDFLFGRSGQPLVFTTQTLSIKRQINNAFQQSVKSSQKFDTKTGLHALMDVPPPVMYMNGPFAGEKNGIDLFFADGPTNFDLAFLSGLDFDLFILYGLLYATMDANIGSTFWCMLTIYLIDVLFAWYRGKEGTANLGSKTLFDERFFL